jgi:hypothetical protein
MLHTEIKIQCGQKKGRERDFVDKLFPITMIPMDRGFCITLHKAKAAI